MKGRVDEFGAAGCAASDGKERSGTVWRPETGPGQRQRGNVGTSEGAAKQAGDDMAVAGTEHRQAEPAQSARIPDRGRVRYSVWKPGLGSDPLEGQASCLVHQATEGMQVTQEVDDGVFFAPSGQAEAVQALEAQMFDGAITTLGQVAASIALLPGLGGIGYFAGQAY